MEFLRTRPGRETSVCSLMVAVCSFFAFLRVAQLLLEGCLELQPELGVTTCWISGFFIGSSVDFGQYIGLLDTILHVLDQWTLYRVLDTM